VHKPLRNNPERGRPEMAAFFSRRTFITAADCA
jgi:hypothetical protein